VGGTLAPRKGEIDQLRSRLAVGAKDEEPHVPASYQVDRIGQPRVTGKDGATCYPHVDKPPEGRGGEG